MAKAVKILVKMESTANTGTVYVAEKNPRTHPEKMSMKTYDKKARTHVEFVVPVVCAFLLTHFCFSFHP